MRALALLKRRGFLGGEVDLFCRSVFALLEGFRSLRENPDVSCHACEEATMSVHLALLGLLRDLDETGFDFNPEVRFDRFCEELKRNILESGVGRFDVFIWVREASTCGVSIQ